MKVQHAKSVLSVSSDVKLQEVNHRWTALK